MLTGSQGPSVSQGFLRMSRLLKKTHGPGLIRELPVRRGSDDYLPGCPYTTPAKATSHIPVIVAHSSSRRVRLGDENPVWVCANLWDVLTPFLVLTSSSSLSFLFSCWDEDTELLFSLVMAWWETAGLPFSVWTITTRSILSQQRRTKIQTLTHATFFNWKEKNYFQVEADFLLIVGDTLFLLFSYWVVLYYNTACGRNKQHLTAHRADCVKPSRLFWPTVMQNRL